MTWADAVPLFIDEHIKHMAVKYSDRDWKNNQFLTYFVDKVFKLYMPIINY